MSNTRGYGGARAGSGSAPFGTDYNVTTPGRLVGGRQQVAHPDRMQAYPALPAIQAQDRDGQQRRGRPGTQQSDTSDADPAIFSTRKSYAADVIVKQMKLCDPTQITDLENRIRKLQRDHRDCVEGNQILRAARGSSVRLSAPDFIALLKELDRFGNATVPSAKLEEIFEAVRSQGKEGRLKMSAAPERRGRAHMGISNKSQFAIQDGYVSEEDTAAEDGYNVGHHASSPPERVVAPPPQRQRDQRTHHRPRPRPPSAPRPAPSEAPGLGPPTLPPVSTSMSVTYPAPGHHTGINRPRAGYEPYEPYRPSPLPPGPGGPAQMSSHTSHSQPVYRPPPPQMAQPMAQPIPTFQLGQAVAHYDAESGAQTSLQQQIALLQSNRVALDGQRNMILKMRGKVPGY